MTLANNQPERSINTGALLDGSILGLAAVVLLVKMARGALVFYIHPRYTPLIIACAVVLLLVAAFRLREVFTARTEAAGQPVGRYVLFAAPLIVAILVPARPLN